MTWGTIGNVTTTHLDSATDDPSQARVEIYNALIELQAVINGRNAASGVAGLDSSTKVPNTLLPNTIVSSATVDLTLDPSTGRVVIQDIINLTPKTTAELESLAGTTGDVAWCSDGDSGNPCLAVSLAETDSLGNNVWYRVQFGSQIASS